jgi:hypothetical protein
MGYKGKGAKGRKRGDVGDETNHNFVEEAGPGCFISRGASLPAWALGSESLNLRDYSKGSKFPDLAVNPDDGTLSVVNATSAHRVVRPLPTCPRGYESEVMGLPAPFIIP